MGNAWQLGVGCRHPSIDGIPSLDDLLSRKRRSSKTRQELGYLSKFGAIFWECPRSYGPCFCPVLVIGKHALRDELLAHLRPFFVEDWRRRCRVPASRSTLVDS